MSQKPCLVVDGPRKRVRERVDNPNNNNEDGDTVPPAPPIQFDNIDSMDANMYLSRVMEQASQMPEIFSVEASPDTATDGVQNNASMNRVVDVVNPSKRRRTALVNSASAAAQYLVSNYTAIRPPPTIQHVPASGVKWVEQSFANFSRLRKYLEECSFNGVGKKQQTQPPQNQSSIGNTDSGRIPVPAMKDRSEWHVFCVGQDDASGNVGGYFQDGYEDMEANDNYDQEPLWKANLPPEGYTPTVSLLLQMDQVMIRRVLEHMTYFVVLPNGFEVVGQRAAWLYALLARLEKPIHRDDAVVLYSLLKKLTLLREEIVLADSVKPSSLSPQAPTTHNRLSILNLLIVIVGIYFEQGGGYSNLMEVKL